MFLHLYCTNRLYSLLCDSVNWNFKGESTKGSETLFCVSIDFTPIDHIHRYGNIYIDIKANTTFVQNSSIEYLYTI